MKQTPSFEVSMPFELDKKIEKQVLYAAAFICRGILSVDYGCGNVRFLSNKPIAIEVFKAGLEKLVERFSKAQIFATDILFQKEKTGKGLGKTEIDNLISDGTIHESHQGVFLWREPLSLFFQFLDDALVRRFAMPFDASEEKFPNVIGTKELIKTNHLSSFPEHLNFVSNIEPELDTLDTFGLNAKAADSLDFINAQIMDTPQLIHNPSTCYHCYSSRAGQKINKNTVITALASCHRYEGANHKQLGRLMEFSLREVIFLGEPNFVRETRLECLKLIQVFARDWEIGGVLQSENDPFFTSDFEVMAEHQRKMKMKYEYRAHISDDDDGLAILSSNLHGLTFSKTFNIDGEDWPVHTGCLGFGLERMVIALIAQHGVNPRSWPEKLKSEWGSWFDARRVGTNN